MGKEMGKWVKNSDRHFIKEKWKTSSTWKSDQVIELIIREM